MSEQSLFPNYEVPGTAIPANPNPFTEAVELQPIDTPPKATPLTVHATGYFEKNTNTGSVQIHDSEVVYGD